MSQTAAEILTAALALPEPERAEIAEALAASVGTEGGSLHPAWPAELRRRAAEVESGQVTPIPWDEVRQQVRALLDADGPNDG